MFIQLQQRTRRQQFYSRNDGFDHVIAIVSGDANWFANETDDDASVFKRNG